MEFPKFEGFKENTFYCWPPKVSANFSSLSPEERKSILEQKERLEKEKQEIIITIAKNLDSPNRNMRQYNFVDIEDSDATSKVLDLISKSINSTIKDHIKSQFPKREDLSDEEYE